MAPIFFKICPDVDFCHIFWTSFSAEYFLLRTPIFDAKYVHLVTGHIDGQSLCPS